MSTENPYAAPHAELTDEISEDRATQLVALRQSCIRREFTIRAWGYAKLAVSVVLFGWLFTYAVSGQSSAASQPWVVFSSGLAGILVGHLFPAIGLMRLYSWSRWWQIGLNAYFVLLAIVALVAGQAVADGQAFAVILLFALNTSLLYLMASRTTRVVLSTDYYQACRVSAVSMLLRHILFKLLGFTALELLQIGALFSLGLKTTGWLGLG